MKSYRVTVQGQTFDVTVDEVKPAAPPSVRRAPRPASSAGPSTGQPAKEHRVLAPMPGKVVALKVVPGDRVATGAPLIVLEAMKMENDLVSSVDGTVKTIRVRPGARVNTGDLLLIIE